MKYSSLLFTGFLLALQGLSCGRTSTTDWIAVAPAGNAHTNVRKDSVTVLPNGRILTTVDPSAPQFARRKNNPIPLYAGEKESPIKHIIYVVKENRTYDELFGQVRGGVGDSTLARYGAGRTLRSPQGDVLQDVTIMPNHLKLVGRFTLADNFYCDSDHSADGHRWLSGTYPNEWVETNVSSSYGGGRAPKGESRAPGALAMTGASGAVYPEDYDGSHSAIEVAGDIALQKGKHSIRLLYFEDSEGQELSLGYSGPGISRQKVPAGVFSH
jgi:hypothetical protein